MEFDWGWIQRINVKRWSYRKLAIVGFLLLVPIAGASAAYLRGWLTDRTDPPALGQRPCVTGTINAASGSTVNINCNGDHVAQHNSQPYNTLRPPLSVGDLLSPNPSIPPVARDDSGKNRIAQESRKPKAAKDADPFVARKFRMVPAEDDSALSIGPQVIEGYCVFDRYIQCFMPPGAGRETPVRIPEKIR
jgi:hypothetical protein